MDSKYVIIILLIGIGAIIIVLYPSVGGFFGSMLGVKDNVNTTSSLLITFPDGGERFELNSGMSIKWIVGADFFKNLNNGSKIEIYLIRPNGEIVGYITSLWKDPNLGSAFVPGRNSFDWNISKLAYTKLSSLDNTIGLPDPAYYRILILTRDGLATSTLVGAQEGEPKFFISNSDKFVDNKIVVNCGGSSCGEFKLLASDTSNADFAIKYPEDQAKLTKIYQNDKYGFRIKYPEYWKFDELNNWQSSLNENGAAAIFPKDASDIKKARVVIKISPEGLAQGYFDKYVSSSAKPGISMSASGYSEIKDADFAGRKAREYISSSTAEWGNDFYLRTIRINDLGGTDWPENNEISVYIYPANFHLIEIANSILSTFQFIKYGFQDPATNFQFSFCNCAHINQTQYDPQKCYEAKFISAETRSDLNYKVSIISGKISYIELNYYRDVQKWSKIIFNQDGRAILATKSKPPELPDESVDEVPLSGGEINDIKNIGEALYNYALDLNRWSENCGSEYR